MVKKKKAEHPDKILTTELDTVTTNPEVDSMPWIHALVINNSAFQPKSGFSPHYGFDVAVRNLKDLFLYLGFNVIVKQDLTKEKIQKCIEKFKQQFKEISPDMCIVRRMFHGCSALEPFRILPRNMAGL